MEDFNIEKDLDDLPNDIIEISISYCGLTYIPNLSRFYNLQVLNCSYNNLTCIPELNKTLIKLNCSNNKLTCLPELNENLEELYCEYNNLAIMPYMHPTLKNIWYHSNTIYCIIDRTYLYNPFYENDTELYNKIILSIKQNINTLFNVRHLIACLKFKRQFRDWLWKRVREPKIMRQFHPSYLEKQLREEDTDIDEVLANWD